MNVAHANLGRKPSRRASVRSLFLARAYEREGLIAAKAFPAVEYQAKPVAFAEEILGVRLWSAQVDIIESIRENPRTSVVGGRKIGKDFAIGVASLWWYACFARARVFATATTGKQVEGILYREIRSLFMFSGRCVACKAEQPDTNEPCIHSRKITGQVGQRASTGIKSEDFREILGFTADKAEGMAGWSGERVLAVVDEASGVKDEIHTAIRGNLASENSREVLISNGTKRSGFFYKSQHESKDRYHTITVSSESTPNVIEGREIYPGLASASWIEEQKNDWGADSDMYRVHVLGQFPRREEGAIFSVEAITASCLRWEETAPTGQLTIGIDPAGDSGSGDESGFSSVRGKKQVHLSVRRGLTPEGHLVEALGLIGIHRDPASTEPVRIVIDRDGDIGAKVFGVFVGYLETHKDAFVLVGVRSGERAQRKPQTYDRVRDELVAVLADWIRDGGALIEDRKLQGEANAFRWIDQVSGRSKALGKHELREMLGRSPDRFDATALSTWRSTAYAEAAVAQTKPGATATAAAQTHAEEQGADVTFDPYASPY